MGAFFPIVYIRGYALSKSEVEAAFNSPYYGFNLGSTQIKQRRDAKPAMFIFESPVVRLIKDRGYLDAFGRYVDHQNQPIAGSAAREWRKTLWTFRFYDAESRLRGGERPEEDIERYAEQLAVFLDQVRKACGAPADYKVNLVAHSMGGLVARCYLQYQKLFEGSALRGITPVAVNKLFTYGTPHRGISFRDGLGWVEDIRDLIGWRGSDAFGEQRMRKYLSLSEEEPLHTYQPARGGLPRERIFCVVGTNWQDYPVGASRATVGPGSDGLVALENAYVKGASRAHIYRSHSGPYGLVNSEAGFQNLDRFLFGSLRYELQLEPMSITASALPGQQPDGEVDYLLVEMTVAIRGLHSYIHQRREATLSAVSVPIAAGAQEKRQATHLYTGFLHTAPASRKKGDRYVRGALDVRIEPHYRDEGLFLDSRYEGGGPVARPALYSARPQDSRGCLPVERNAELSSCLAG